MKAVFKFFYHYLFSSKSNSLIKSISVVSILSLVISIASLLIVISIMNGFGLSIRDRLLSFEPHLIVEPENQTRSTSKHGSKMKRSIQARFKEQGLLGGVQEIRLFETQDLIITNSDREFTGGIGRGYLKQDLKKLIIKREKKYFEKMNSYFELNLDEQEVAAQSSFKNLSPSVYMNFELAQQLSVFRGDEITLLPADSLLLPPSVIPLIEEARVASILYTTESSILTNSFLYEIQSFPSLQNTPSLSYGVEIFLKNPDQYLTYQSALKDFNNFRVQSWSDRHSSLFFALKIEKMMMILFLTLAALIACFSISAMISLLITQKRKDIGALMTMGWSAQKVKRLFTMISLLISAIGVLGGALLGYLTCLLIKYTEINILPDIYHDRKIPVEINPETFLFVCLATLALAFLSSLLPIHRLATSSCVQLLKKSMVK